jgi:hypothetical protein
MDIDPKPLPELSAAWSREIERRVREVEEGAVELIDWEDIRKGTVRGVRLRLPCRPSERVILPD